MIDKMHTLTIVLTNGDSMLAVGETPPFLKESARRRNFSDYDMHWIQL